MLIVFFQQIMSDPAHDPEDMSGSEGDQMGSSPPSKNSILVYNIPCHDSF